MLRLLADEDLNNDIVRGVLRQRPAADLVRVQDVGLSGADDITILEWAASEERVVITHDVSTMTLHAINRIREGLNMPGIFEVSHRLPVGEVIRDILLLVDYSLEGEWHGQIRYLPLR